MADNATVSDSSNCIAHIATCYSVSIVTLAALWHVTRFYYSSTLNNVGFEVGVARDD